ncbi:DUF5336 domain-containing protein [Haloechinothrix sp. YIM 98757]|uniref:DUF5336 domain-containing protein n=1 Tax=Haloechinothrix aidingensis TaxID=2752311 RepID=A0A838AE46_9PSEU|nr:DUF5336 domain-containing protein [Haloechinothrix aidingensis]MBA0127457.1 DUF5336 domain-containing protein [Haloechinothrix aidingensis]
MTSPQDPQDPYDPARQPPPYPQAPQVDPNTVQAPPRPKSVDTAFMLWMASVVIGIVSSLLSLISQDAINEESAERLGATADQAEAGAAGGTLGIVIGLVIAVILAGLAFAMRNGANWARIVLTVLGGIGLLFGLLGLLTLPVYFAIGFVGALIGLLQIASLAVIAAAIVFMFRAESNHYFRYS